MATNFYSVTATALNLRSTPSRDAVILDVVPHGESVMASGEPSGGWLPVTYLGKAGYVASNFVRKATSLVDAVQAATDTTATAAVDVESKQRDLALLHPLVRDKVNLLLAELAAAGHAFRVYEAFRTPERQQWLYAKGRTRPGGIVTNARAWASFHQFGLAADLVLFVDGNWTWETGGARTAPWRQMRDLAAQSGLRTLSWEQPHVELPVLLDDWDKGGLLTSGDATWRDNLETTVARWKRSGGTGGPNLEPSERPPLPAEASA